MYNFVVIAVAADDQTIENLVVCGQTDSLVQ